MVFTTIQIALGGAIGASLRYWLGLGAVRLFGAGFPMGIWPVNILGSFLMGLFIVWAAHRGGTGWHPFVAVGVLGGFTTFSAFSLETVTLIERGLWGQAGLYMGLSVIGSIAALFAGVMMARGVWG